MRGKLKFIGELVVGSLFAPMRGEQRPPVLARPDQLGVTFIGHSSFLLQIGGRNILVDPVFARWLVVLRRLRRPGVAIRQLPAIDAVLLTHAHMDHLNRPSLRRIVRRMRSLHGRAPEVIVPRGVGDLVAAFKFSRTTEMDWWQRTNVGDVEITMTPAQHWGARMFSDTHRGFGGYVLRAGANSIYHSGDTAYFHGFSEIGARLKPGVALLPIGAYSPDNFRSVHTSPEDALRAFEDLGARLMVPMHYGTFRLSREPVEEPLPRLLAAAERAGIADRMLPLREGETRLFDGDGEETLTPEMSARYGDDSVLVHSRRILTL